MNKISIMKKRTAAKKKKTVKKKTVVRKAPKRSSVRRAAKRGAARKKAVKRAAKKTVRKTAKRGSSVRATFLEVRKPIGLVTHFYNEIGVAIVRFKESVPLGTVLYFRGATTDFKHSVKSMQYDHEPISIAPKGKQIGIKVPKRVRKGDRVHRT